MMDSSDYVTKFLPLLLGTLLVFIFLPQKWWGGGGAVCKHVPVNTVIAELVNEKSKGARDIQLITKQKVVKRIKFKTHNCAKLKKLFTDVEKIKQVLNVVVRLERSKRATLHEALQLTSYSKLTELMKSKNR